MTWNWNLKKLMPLTYVGKKSTYKIVSILGKGGQGAVFKCKDLNGEFYAIKVFSRFGIDYKKKQIYGYIEENVNRFINECAALHRYRHENIIKALDHGTVEFLNLNINFFIMELAREKTNIQDYVIKHKIFKNPPEMWRIIKEVLNALIYVYDLEDTFHRDLKPDNILVKKDNTIALTDFGLAYFPDEFKIRRVDSGINRKKHNSRYYAPEQKRIARGEDNIIVDHRSDIFALGQIIHELITGDIIHSSGHIDIGLSNDLFGGSLNSIIRKMTDLGIENRYSSYEEVKRELKKYFRLNREDSLKIDRMTKEIAKNLESIEEEKSTSFKLIINEYYNCIHFPEMKDIASKIKELINWYIHLQNSWLDNIGLTPEPSQSYIRPIIDGLNRGLTYLEQLSSGNITINASRLDHWIQNLLENFVKLTSPSSNDFEELDNLALLEEISGENIESLTKLLARPSNSHYFFTNLRSTVWFTKLNEKGFLNKPTVYNIEGNIDIHFWPQINYLKNISPVLSEEVLGLITTYGTSQNYILNRGYLLCLLHMPLNLVHRSSNFIEGIFKYYYEILELDFLMQLIRRCIDESENQIAYQLLGLLINLKAPEASKPPYISWDPLYHAYYYLFSNKREFIDLIVDFDNLSEDPRILMIMINSLKNRLRVEYGIEGDVGSDFIFNPRTSLLDVDLAYSSRIIDLFIDEILFLLDNINTKTRRASYLVLMEQEWIIFRRIALTLLIKFPTEFQEEIKIVLTERDYFLNEALKYEILPLLNKAYGSLTETEKERNKDLILNGPTELTYPYRKEDFSSETKYLSWKENFDRLWILNRIKSIDYPLLHRKLGDYYLSNQHIENLNIVPFNFKTSTANINNISTFDSKFIFEFISREFQFNEIIALELERRINDDPERELIFFESIVQIPRFYYESLYSGLEKFMNRNDFLDTSYFLSFLIPLFNILANELNLLIETELWFSINRITRRVIKSDELNIENLNELYKNFVFLLTNLQNESEIINNHFEDYRTALEFAWDSILGQISWTFFECALKKWKLDDSEENIKSISEDISYFFNSFQDSLIFSIICSSYSAFLFSINQELAQELFKLVFNPEDLQKYSAVWETFLLSYRPSLHQIFQVMISHFEILVSNLLNINLHFEAYNNIIMCILLEYIIYQDQLVFKFIALMSADLLSNMMRLSLLIYRERYKSETETNEDEINRLLELWDYIFSNEEIEMLPYDSKYKIYSWYPSLFEDLKIDERHLRNLNKFLDLTRGRIRSSHSVIKHLLNYVGLNDSMILEVLLKILRSHAKNDIYYHTFRQILELLLSIEIIDLLKLRKICNSSIRRGDQTIWEEFRNRFEDKLE